MTDTPDKKDNAAAAPRRMSLERIAHHEAGHAVCALLLQVAFAEVTIKPTDDYLGVCGLLTWPETYTRYMWVKNLDAYVLRKAPDKRRARAHVEKLAMCQCAGYVADHRFTGDAFIGKPHPLVAAAGDFDSAIATLEPVCRRGDDIMRYFNETLIKTFKLVTRPSTWFLVERVASALLEKETLTLVQAEAVARAARAEYAGLGRSVKSKRQEEATTYLETTGVQTPITKGAAK